MADLTLRKEDRLAGAIGFWSVGNKYCPFTYNISWPLANKICVVSISACALNDSKSRKVCGCLILSNRDKIGLRMHKYTAMRYTRCMQARRGTSELTQGCMGVGGGHGRGRRGGEDFHPACGFMV